MKPFNYTTVEYKLDKVLHMLEEKHGKQLGSSFKGDQFKELVLTTLFGGVFGYFIFKTMDSVFGKSYARKRS